MDRGLILLAARVLFDLTFRYRLRDLVLVAHCFNKPWVQGMFTVTKFMGSLLLLHEDQRWLDKASTSFQRRALDRRPGPIQVLLLLALARYLASASCLRFPVIIYVLPEGVPRAVGFPCWLEHVVLVVLSRWLATANKRMRRARVMVLAVLI